VWIYWFHDFRKMRMMVQRVCGEGIETQTTAVAALLYDTVEEATRWGFTTVQVWDPTEGLLRAMELLERSFGVEIVTEERVGSSITSVRWKDQRAPSVSTLQLNEFYGWS
jgi:hypothetical protein